MPTQASRQGGLTPGGRLAQALDRRLLKVERWRFALRQPLADDGLDGQAGVTVFPGDLLGDA